jgi:sigma-B regulation protein RsbU (phosphoserine phosphatase)
LSEVPEPEDLEDLYETAPCGYVSILPEGTIAKANRTLADWLGVSGGDKLVGKSLHEILGFGGKIAYETHLAPLLRMQGHVHEIALDLLTVSGEKLPTIANAAEKRDDEGRHLFTRLTLFKAVDRRTFERSLIEARVKAETETKVHRDAALLREQFIAVLGHDIRNPLAALAAGIGMLERKEQLSERGFLILREMTGSIDRAAALVDDLHDLARGSLGGGFPISRDVDAPLTPVLEQVVAELRSIAPEREIAVHIDIEEPVFCDRSRMAQLASNLLANAITHGAHDQPIRFEARTKGGVFSLFVCNGGAAIPDDIRERLFQPFFRGATRASRNGLGLGLYIASEIAKAHGAKLEVSSTAEETCFTLEFNARAPG